MVEDFQNILYSCFPVVRRKQYTHHNEMVLKYLKQKTLLNSLIENIKCSEFSIEDKINMIYDIKSSISIIDGMICILSAEGNVKKIREHYSSLSEDGKFSVSGTWKLKKKLNFKVPDVPTSKLDKKQ